MSLLETLPLDRLQRVYELVATMANGKAGATTAPTIDQLAVIQGVDLNTRIGDVVFDFWIEDDSVDEFIALRRARRGNRASVPSTDAWVAACALRYGCPLVTNNATDFDNINQLVVISF